MPMAIDRGTFFAVRGRDDGRARIASTLDGATQGLDLADLVRSPEPRSGTWVDYPLGVVLRLLRAGRASGGFDVLIGGNLPIGAGLSSSASVCIGTAYALTSLWGEVAAPEELIEVALWAEREFVGVKCGIMDPYAVTLTRPGHILWLDCADRRVEHLPLDPDSVTIAVADTGVRRELARGEFNQRVAQCARAFEVLHRRQPEARCLAQVRRETLEESAHELEPVVFRRALHVLTETARAHDAREALLAGDLLRFGRNMTSAHASLRELYDVSIEELDVLVDAALDWDGVLGARLTGAGFGGCVVAAVTSGHRAGLREHLTERYRKRFDSEPTVEFFRGGSGPREVADLA